jgi:cation:H+ antiporter
MSATTLLLFVIGLVLLVVGAEALVRGASRLASAVGVSPLVIGLTVVAYGTSAPEMAVSVQASWAGNAGLALGNVVGSNIFNIVAVLGLSALVAPAGIAVPEAALGFDLPVMIAVAVACLPIFFTGYLIARWEGALFLAYYAAYTAYLILAAREHGALPLFNTALLGFALPLTAVTLLTTLAIRALRQSKNVF